MTETIARSYVLSQADLEIVREKARKMGDTSDSAALRMIIREWAELTAQSQQSQKIETNEQ